MPIARPWNVENECQDNLDILEECGHLTHMASPSCREIGGQPATLASSFHPFTLVDILAQKNLQNPELEQKTLQNEKGTSLSSVAQCLLVTKGQ